MQTGGRGIAELEDLAKTIPHRLRRSSLYTREPSLLTLRTTHFKENTRGLHQKRCSPLCIRARRNNRAKNQPFSMKGDREAFVDPAQCFAFRTFACSVLRTLNPQKFDYGLRPPLRMTCWLLVLHHSHEVRTSLVLCTNFTFSTKKLHLPTANFTRAKRELTPCSPTAKAVALRAMFRQGRNARGAICARALASELADAASLDYHSHEVRTTFTRLRLARKHFTREAYFTHLCISQIPQGIYFTASALALAPLSPCFAAPLVPPPKNNSSYLHRCAVQIYHMPQAYIIPHMPQAYIIVLEPPAKFGKNDGRKFGKTLDKSLQKVYNDYNYKIRWANYAIFSISRFCAGNARRTLRVEIGKLFCS